VGGALSVVVVGDVMDDVLVRPRGPTALGSDTESEIRRRPGGSGANQAAWLASLGVPVRFYGRVGTADVVRHSDALGRSGVDARLGGDPDEPTGTIVVLVEPTERHMFTDRAANRRLAREDLPRSFDGVDHLHVSGYALFDPRSRVAVADLLRAARAASVSFSVDPSSESYLREMGPSEFLRLTAGAALAFPNAAEATLLGGSPDVESAAVALTERYDTVAVKLGAQGALVVSRGARPVQVPPSSADVVDTTGAGDAFFAGYLAGHLRGLGPVEAGRAAVVAAGRAVVQLGGRPPAA